MKEEKEKKILSIPNTQQSSSARFRHFPAIPVAGWEEVLCFFDERMERSIALHGWVYL
jgi:hypothetical protein